MTETNEPTTEARTALSADGAAVAPPSCGRMLAEARERQGISVVDMAARLRLHPKQIAAIEADDLDRLPGGPFVRGFVRNYAKELRLDPAPLLEALRERLPPAQAAAEATTSGTSQIVRDARREWVSRRVVIVGAVGALLALGIVGWFSTRSMPPAEKRGQAVVQPLPATPAAQSAADARPTTGADLPAPGGASVSVTPTTQVEPIIAAAPAGASPIRLAFRERAWVEVTQADGRVLLSQNNDAGSEQKLDGKPPFKLVIGNASAVTLEYRGRPVDLKPLTSIENVARVTLE